MQAQPSEIAFRSCVQPFSCRCCSDLKTKQANSLNLGMSRLSYMRRRHASSKRGGTYEPKRIHCYERGSDHRAVIGYGVRPSALGSVLGAVGGVGIVAVL